jgi:hypothetical protein
MAEKRIVKADELIPTKAEGSLIDRLRKRRIAIDEGDASGGDAFKPNKEDHQRGYTKEKWE